MHNPTFCLFSLWAWPAGAGEMQYHTDAAENHAVECCLSDPPSSPSLLLGTTGFQFRGLSREKLGQRRRWTSSWVGSRVLWLISFQYRWGVH
ncbi:hypothetical protein B0J15DRAFT_489673 [Fusarium solani]|uniref:Secreted protein n=1 Tax=Fusarium solani TaxID=169388 RepID=A0A9P9HUG2_FUSSL|nr:uncharacterized protein B0J15DRAFT_489673 [Fusarium solani]KAH7263989.1 hypothetical protein B0J15DRAFT_489673 [Fusarium solani]